MFHDYPSLNIFICSDSKKSKGKDSKTSKKVAEPPPESPKPESPETINPLLDVPLEKEQDRLFMPGNTTLAYLTLACRLIFLII